MAARHGFIGWFLHDPRIGWYVSLVFHALLVVLLGILTVPGPEREVARLLIAEPYERDQELVTEVLDDSLEISVPVDSALLDVQEMELEAAELELEAPVIEETDLSQMTDIARVELADLSAASSAGERLFAELSENIVVAASTSAGGNEEAVDRITDELMQMLFSRKLLVVWLFDESESMIPDQKRIRQRVERIYTELGLRGRGGGDTLVTSVASFGSDYHLHTPQPVRELEEVRQAIDRVPVCESGEENMCSAVLAALHYHRRFLPVEPDADSGEAAPGTGDLAFDRRRGSAEQDRRKMVMIIVSDESGERPDNMQRLEEAVSLAKRLDCRIYVLGREASFGHPYATVDWTDPGSGQTFRVQIDRGPETPSLELLQTDGDGRRGDIILSGFGPYEQSRLARATGGIFFMVPDPDDSESAEARGQRTAHLRGYMPSLQSREEYIRERNANRMRRAIAKIIVDLDTWNPDVRDNISRTHYFSVERDRYVRAARGQVRKAAELIAYYDQAIQTLENLRDQRNRETDRRWQANYDLLLAQLTAYRLRTQQYAEAVSGGIERLPPVTNPRGNDEKTTHWRARTHRELIHPEKYQSQRELADRRLQQVIDEHPGTPWAVRAQWELRRDYGYRLVEHYSAPRPPRPSQPRPEPPKI